MFRKVFAAIIVACMLANLISCASIINGRNQQLPVVTNPSDAVVTVGTIRQVSPATFVLDRRQELYVVKIEKDGYEPVQITLRKGVNGWVFGNILFGFSGIIGLVIDLSTGAASKFQPSSVEVSLMSQKMGLKDLKGKDVLFVSLVESNRK